MRCTACGLFVLSTIALVASCSDDEGQGSEWGRGGSSATDASAEVSATGGTAGSTATGGSSGQSPDDAGVDACTCGDGVCNCGETEQSCSKDCCSASVSTESARGSDLPVMVRNSYDYVPSVMHDGVYRMWWCGGIAGDHILYAEASSLDGPWHARGSSTPGTYDDVLQPTGNAADFDGLHTCDPSVVRVDGVYYMYYGGLATETAADSTRIGVARSDDGMSWTRLNAGKPIIVPARDWNTMINKYGAGQPSAIALDGWIYLIFTDTTGLGINPGNGAGQFVMRSKDPAFQTEVEELGEQGFAPYDPAKHTAFKRLESFSVDWQFIDAIDAFVIASHTSGGKTRLHLFDRALAKDLGEVEVSGSWTEGPGIVSRPDKHAIASSSCGRVPIDIMRSVGPGGPETWDLAHDGIDMLTGQSCACTPWPRILEGYLMSSAGLPLTMVRGGERLQFALRPPADRLARSSIEVSSEVFHAVPFGASMAANAPVIGADGRPAAFHLDNRLWPVSCLEVITDNGSSIQSVSAAEWDAVPLAHSLHCLK